VLRWSPTTVSPKHPCLGIQYSRNGSQIVHWRKNRLCELQVAWKLWRWREVLLSTRHQLSA